MAKRPDLDALIVPKGADPAPAAIPASSSGHSETAPKGYAHTLSLRLTADQYRKLRRFVVGQEEHSGRRVTHQAVIEAALDAYIDGSAR